jgi:hypothetical protein
MPALCHAARGSVALDHSLLESKLPFEIIHDRELETRCPQRGEVSTDTLIAAIGFCISNLSFRQFKIMSMISVSSGSVHNRLLGRAPVSIDLPTGKGSPMSSSAKPYDVPNVG